MPAVGWIGAMYFLASICLVCIPLGYYLTRNSAVVSHASTTVQQPEQTLGQAVRSALKMQIIGSFILVFLPVDFILLF